jgi:hypothetical protein
MKMRIREMKNYYTLLLIVLLLLIIKTDAPAETIKTMKCKEVGYAKKIQLADVPDFKGHIVGMFERRGLDIFEDGTVAVYKQMGSMDGWDTGATCQGYTELSFEDGSTIIYKFQGSEDTKTGELPRLKGEGTFIKGTGRFRGIKGTLKFTGRYYTSLDDDNKGAAIFEIVATYTLP